MNEESTSPTGNRWEPTEQPVADHSAPGPAPAPAPAPDLAEEPRYAEAVPARTSWLTRGRTAVAAGAAAVLVAGGLGGFALGRASAGGNDGAQLDRQGVPSGFDQGRGDDGDGRGLPGGPGLAPPNGQVPGSNGADDGQDSSGTDTKDS